MNSDILGEYGTCFIVFLRTGTRMQNALRAPAVAWKLLQPSEAYREFHCAAERKIMLVHYMLVHKETVLSALPDPKSSLFTG
jgi:hypothetical protein